MFHEIWEMLIDLPEYVDSIGNFLSSNYWPPFKREAQKTLKVLMKRGYLSDKKPELNTYEAPRSQQAKAD